MMMIITAPGLSLLLFAQAFVLSAVAVLGMIFIPAGLGYYIHAGGHSPLHVYLETSIWGPEYTFVFLVSGFIMVGVALPVAFSICTGKDIHNTHDDQAQKAITAWGFLLCSTGGYVLGAGVGDLGIYGVIWHFFKYGVVVAVIMVILDTILQKPKREKSKKKH